MVLKSDESDKCLAVLKEKKNFLFTVLWPLTSNLILVLFLCLVGLGDSSQVQDKEVTEGVTSGHRPIPAPNHKPKQEAKDPALDLCVQTLWPSTEFTREQAFRVGKQTNINLINYLFFSPT